MIPGKTEIALMQVRQGDKADLRQLEQGQFGYAIDTGELFIGAPNEGRLSGTGRAFRNLKILTELNGTSSSTSLILDVILQAGSEEGTLKLIKTFSTGTDVEVDNIPVRNVLTESDAARFVAVEQIYDELILNEDESHDLIPSLNSINLTLLDRLQHYINNNKKYSEIIELNSPDDDNVTTPMSVDKTLKDRLAIYLNNVDYPKVVTRISDDITYNAADISIDFTTTNTVNKIGTTTTLTFLPATSSTAGILSANDYVTIQGYGTRLDKLEAGGVWRGSFLNIEDLPQNNRSSRLAGGYADLNDYVTVRDAEVSGSDHQRGEAVFRLLKYDAQSGEIPAESVTATQTVGSSLSNIEVDIDQFKTKISYDCTTVFTYVASSQKWRVFALEVDISEYGISFTGTPNDGDELTVVYVSSGWVFDYWLSFEINIATVQDPGLVRSSLATNSVYVGLDGTMLVNCYSDHETRISTNTTEVAKRVMINQGTANAGKIMVINSSGNLVPSSYQMNTGIWDYENSEFISYVTNPLDDWNNVPSGIYNLTTDHNTLNGITGDTGTDYHVTCTSYNNKKIQIAIDMSNPMKQYVRSFNGSIWSTWTYAYASWVPGVN